MNVQTKSSIAATMAKMAVLPNILAAGNLLYAAGVIKVDGAACVRVYVKKNPDINEALQRAETFAK